MHLLGPFVSGSGRLLPPRALLLDAQAEALPQVCVTGVLGEGPADAFNPDLLRDEPADKVRFGALQPDSLRASRLVRSSYSRAEQAGRQAVPSNIASCVYSACSEKYRALD